MRKLIGRAFTVVRRALAALAIIGLGSWAVTKGITWAFDPLRGLRAGLLDTITWPFPIPLPSLREVVCWAPYLSVWAFERAAVATTTGLVLAGRAISAGAILGPVRRCTPLLLGLAGLKLVLEMVSQVWIDRIDRLDARFLLAVPFWLAWLLVTPVMVEEGSGPIRAMARSADLTRGRRWQLLAAAAVAGIPLVLTSAARLLPQDQGRDWVLPLEAVGAALAGLPLAVLPAVAFHLLRQHREGARAEGLAEVFE